MLELIIVPPLLAGLLCFTLSRHPRAAEALALAGALLSALFALFALSTLLSTSSGFHDFNGLLYIDSVSALFTTLTAIVASLIFLYSIGYMRQEVHETVVEEIRLGTYYGLLSLFLAAMLTATLSAHPMVMWAAIEATTLAPVFLIGFYNSSSSIEAAWKFFIINSVGILLALVGILLLLHALVPAGSSATGDWASLFAVQPEANLLFLKVAMAFILVGFGTKIGLVPLHVWLPDAHSQAPTPVSALLSGLLLNIAFYGIVRSYQVIVPYAPIVEFVSGLLILFGLMSLAIGALRLYYQQNIKRMLAYSSIENMGIVALAFGLGGPVGIAAGLLHLVSHSLAKPLAFFASGMMAFAFKTKEIPLIRGGAQVVPLVAIPFVFVAIGLAGSPPFGTFLSELGVLAASLSASQWVVAVLFIIFTTITFASLLYRISAMCMGEQPHDLQPYTPHWTMLLPFFLLLVLTIYLGLFPPAQFISLLSDAVHTILGR